jgi:hypothetical protein
MEPKLEVIKMLAGDCANCSKTCGNYSDEQICCNYVDGNGFEGRHCCSSKLGKFGVIEDGGSLDNLERRMDLKKLQQTKTEQINSYAGSHHLQNQPNLGVTNDIRKLKELDSGKSDLRNQRELRKNENYCGSTSQVLHYTVCLHGWGNIVLFSDSVAL